MKERVIKKEGGNSEREVGKSKREEREGWKSDREKKRGQIY